MIPPLSPFFAARNCTVPQIGLLQPADPFLDIAGEDLRRRIFITAGQRGEALCLRPEFTIPVCLHHLAGTGAAARYAYEGTVFRQRIDEPSEFRQAGIEDIGNAGHVEADAAIVADLVGALELLGVRNWTLAIGDQSVFEAVLSQLGLPPAWHKRLGRAFGDSDRLKADVIRLAVGSRHETAALPAKVRDAVMAGEPAVVEGLIAAQMAAAGLSQSGGRTPAEIAARVLEKAELAAARLDNAHADALNAFLEISVPVSGGPAALAKIGRDHDLGLDAAIAAFAARIEAMQGAGLPLERFAYRAGFGRRLDYYTGLVFEVLVPGLAKPLAGGGRYDKLLNLLGAGNAVPAIGFSIWLDRVEQATRGRAV